MQVSTLEGYEFVTVAKLKILVYLAPQRNKGKSHFENGGKAHDVVVITRKYSYNSYTQRRVNNMVLIYDNIEVYMCIQGKISMNIC